MQNQITKTIKHKINIVKRDYFPNIYSHAYIPKVKPSSRESEKIFDKEDTRVLVEDEFEFPYSAIGRLVLKVEQTTKKTRTAFLVGPDLVLTATQNIFLDGALLDPQGIFYYPSGRRNPVKIIQWHFPQKPQQKFNSYNDYALLKLGTRVGYQYGYFGLDFRGFVQKQSHLFGFPLQIVTEEGQKSAQGKLYGTTGNINRYRRNNIAHNIPTTAGQAGSPIYQIAQNGDYLVVGISHNHTKEHNNAVSIDSNIQKQLNSWIQNPFASFNLEQNPYRAFKGNRQITQEELKALCKVPNIEILNLNNNKIGDSGFQCLIRAKWNLCELNLNNTDLGVQGVKKLVKAVWPQLTLLSLSNNNLSDQGCEQIAKGKWERLNKLYLSDNKINPIGMSNLVKGNWPYLLQLNISKNNIGNQGVGFLVQADWPRLKQIWVVDTQIKETEKKSLRNKWSPAFMTKTIPDLFIHQNQNTQTLHQNLSSNLSSDIH